MPNYKNDDDIDISKVLDKIVKLQAEQEQSRQEENKILIENLQKMSKLLDELVKVTTTGSTVAATKKIIPFHTGSQSAGQLVIPPSIFTPPPNPDDYPTQINLYQQNDNKPIQHMTLINDGPGELFFVVGYSETDVNRKEGHLNINDQRELFNVYQIRLRSSLPQTTFRLIEGIFRTGSFAPQTKANVEVRPTVQANEILVKLSNTYDNQVPTITITSPTTQTLGADYSIPWDLPPLPPGATATLIDEATGLPMPFIIPEGFIFEAFAVFNNINVDATVRNFFEFVPGSDVFTLSTVFPIAARGSGTINATYNISNFTSQAVDPFGAPAGGRRFLITLTNDDPFNNGIGDVNFLGTLRQLS